MKQKDLLEKLLKGKQNGIVEQGGMFEYKVETKRVIISQVLDDRLDLVTMSYAEALEYLLP